MTQYNCNFEPDNEGTNQRVVFNLFDVNEFKPNFGVPDGTQFCIYEDNNPDGLDCSLLEGRVPLLEATILASDTDGTSQLTASIDWDKTLAQSGFVPVLPEQCQLQDILYLNQSEPDDEGTVRIKIVLGNSALLDRECVDTVFMVIKVTDANPELADTLSSYLSVSILIADLDDNQPVFENWEFIDFVIDENSDKSNSEFEPTNLTQFTIIVSDPDNTDPYFEVSLTPLNPATPYIIIPEDRDNASPNIVLLQDLSIDREDPEIVENDGALTYLLEVTDAAGNSTYRFPTFIVNDINDLDPIFDEIPTGTVVMENEALGTVVIRVQAQDPDVSNKQIM